MQNFRKPAAGEEFNRSFGLMTRSDNVDAFGWQEMTYDQVQCALMREVDKDYEKRLEQISSNARTAVGPAATTLSVLLSSLLDVEPSTTIESIIRVISQTPLHVTPQDIVNSVSADIRITTQDPRALNQGLQIPAHVSLQAWHLSQLSPFQSLESLDKQADDFIRYTKLLHGMASNSYPVGSTVFIGHGRSETWRVLDSYLGEIGVPVEEFNSEPVAGLTALERLQEISKQVCFAFLVMTGDDGHANGTLHARPNVWHETGWFQCLLGLGHAIILLEDGCSEYTNTSSLQYIRFRKGAMSEQFGEIRRVLAREQII